jgi:GT2 family glycosyltransferase
MNKISVIIPTILKNPKVLLKLINLLSDDVAVDEILIIENSGKGLYFPPNDKIKIYNSKENLYVNASWNLGISMIKNERFLIINDDILPVKNFCSLILDSEI